MSVCYNYNSCLKPVSPEPVKAGGMKGGDKITHSKLLGDVQALKEVDRLILNLRKEKLLRALAKKAKENSIAIQVVLFENSFTIHPDGNIDVVEEIPLVNIEEVLESGAHEDETKSILASLLTDAVNNHPNIAVAIMSVGW